MYYNLLNLKYLNMDIELMITLAKKELNAAFKNFDVDKSGVLEKS